VKHTRGVAQARKANRIVQFLRSVCSTATDDVLAAGIRQASGHNGLETFAQEFIKKADRFPEPPLPTQPDFVPLTSAAEFVTLGRTMRNCLPTKIPQALLGLASYYRTQARVGDEIVPVVVELTPLSNGCWSLESLNMLRNQRLPREAVADLVQRLKRVGVAVVVNPHVHPQAKDLVRLLGVYPVGEFQLLGEDEPEMASNEMDAMLEEMMAEMEQALGVA
jgi:hypothetical protein